MNSTKVLPVHQVSVWVLMALCFMPGVSASAQEIQHLSTTHPGGFPGLPVMTGIERNTNGITVTWDGPSGYYQLYQKLGLTNLSWQQVGGPNLTRKTNITALHGNAFFKVSGPAPRYAGSRVCADCHDNVHTRQMQTPHVQAFTNALFVAQGGQTNSSCLACHTVGYRLPTGFVGKDDINTNPRLAGVQCESCHGPAAAHAANELDLSVRPRVELAGQVCGGCHNTEQNPTFDEWKSSGHFSVVEDMSSESRVDSCGRCHSGSARLALIKGHNPLTITNDANVGITCAVCHDPHQTHVWTNVITRIVYTNQLRQALSSTNDFFLSTSDIFTNKYDPSINICAQCHNHRGASWTSSSRSPHHSPQYNMLLGTVGELPAGVKSGPATHAGTRFASSGGRSVLVTNQCVTCHMPKHDSPPGLLPGAAVMNHTFAATISEACVECHGSASNAEGLVDAVTGLIVGKIQDVKSALDAWAATKAPPPLYATYGTRAWEYTTPGDLSPGGPGPTSAEQVLIPDNVKKARFNLYLALYDGSYGVHNGPHSATLLKAARNWVQQELDQ